MMKYGDLFEGIKRVGYINFSHKGIFYVSVNGQHFETGSMAEITAWISYNGFNLK